MFSLSPLLYAIVLVFLGGLFGLLPIRKLILMYEARHALKRGSAGWIRALSGWLFIAVWIFGIAHLAAILGDWHASGDLTGAIDRSWARLHLILEILAALGDSN